MITKENSRQLIIDLLDDEYGINGPAFNGVSLLAENTGNEDIITRVEASEGRWYLGEDDAEELREIKQVD